MLSALLMCLIVAVRYLATSGLFSWAARRRRPDIYIPDDPKKALRLKRQVRAEIRWSLLSAFIYGVPAGITAHLWLHHGQTLIYTRPDQYPLWYMPLSLAAYLFLHDSWFYWSHRAFHHWPRLFRTAHAVHHRSRPPTAWAAMAFHPWEALSGAWLIPALTFILPIHIGMLGLVLSIMTFFGVTNHMGWEIFPKRWVEGWFGRHIISASHHHLHHVEYRANLGLYFRFWDKLCKTDAGLSNEPRVRPSVRPSVRSRPAPRFAKLRPK